MKRIAIAAAAAALATAGIIPALAGDGELVEIGRLECNVEGGVGLVIGSSKDAVCQFYDADSAQPAETYMGRVTRLGLDVGVTDATTIEWAVFAPRLDSYAKGALAGQYVGASAEATLGKGVGANVLVGGSDKSFTLQPVSVQAQTGLNIAAGIAGFQLDPVEPLGQ